MNDKTLIDSIRFNTIKKDDRPQKGFWAPGNYWNVCVKCNSSFVGDKRAVSCADCAYEEKIGESNETS